MNQENQKYTQAVLDDILTDAQHGQSLRDIALRLGVPIAEFLDDYYNPEYKVKEYYETGLAMGKAEIDESTYKLAANHSNTAQAAYRKRVLATKIENKINELKLF